MADLFVSLVTVTPRLSQSTTAAITVKSGGGTDSFGGKTAEVQQAEVQTPGTGK